MLKVNAYYTILREGAVEVRCFVWQGNRRMPTGHLDFTQKEFDSIKEALTEVNWINETITEIGN